MHCFYVKNMLTCTKWTAQNAYLLLTVCGCCSLGLRWLWGRVPAVGTVLQPRPTNRIQRRILIKDGQVHTAIKQLHDVCVCEWCKLVCITYSIILYHAWRISDICCTAELLAEHLEVHVLFIFRLKSKCPHCSKFNIIWYF